MLYIFIILSRTYHIYLIKGKVMHIKIPEISVISISILLIIMGIIYTTRLVQLNNTVPEITYQEMSTAELETKVERLSQNGKLPFPMGRELMKRWAQR
jgi:hypothetical protein